MLSFGRPSERACSIVASRRAFVSGFGSPERAATAISRTSLENKTPFLASVAAFLCLICAHLLWPDIVRFVNVFENCIFCFVQARHKTYFKLPFSRGLYFNGAEMKERFYNPRLLNSDILNPVERNLGHFAVEEAALFNIDKTFVRDNPHIQIIVHPHEKKVGERHKNIEGEREINKRIYDGGVEVKPGHQKRGCYEKYNQYRKENHKDNKLAGNDKPMFADNEKYFF